MFVKNKFYCHVYFFIDVYYYDTPLAGTPLKRGIEEENETEKM